MDRKQYVGIGLMFLLILGCSLFFAPDPKEIEDNSKSTSTEETTNTSTIDKVNPSTVGTNVTSDSAALAEYGIFGAAIAGTEQKVTHQLPIALGVGLAPPVRKIENHPVKSSSSGRKVFG